MSAREEVFDIVRKAVPGVFADPEAIADLDAVLDRLGIPRPEQAKPAIPALSISAAGIALIQRYEGFARLRPDGKIEAYPDPGTGGAPWTIGWGSTGADIKRGTVWTRQQCDERFTQHLEHFADEVRKAIGDAPTTQGQFDALVSFHYNTGAIARATLTKLHRAGNYAAAKAEFAKWNKAAGRVLSGLVKRRAAEAALYGGNDNA